MQITPAQLLAWRLTRQFLSPRTAESTNDIIQRLCGIQAQVASAASQTVATRQQEPDTSQLKANLKNGTLLKTWTVRGTLHLHRPDQAANVLSLMADARTWEKPSWQKNFGATPVQVDQLTEAVREILNNAALSREELVTALLRRRQFAGLEAELRSGWGAVLKPLAWRGALCHGPAQGSRITFTTPAHVVPDWKGLPDPDEAAPTVISAYLGAYGPATPETFDAWLTRGNTKKGRLRAWFAEIRDQLTEVEVEGRTVFLPSEHADALATTKPHRDVRLLGPFDAYVLGAGTSDTLMLAAAHRGLVSRAAGWISPVVLHGGRIVGTWEIADGRVVPHWFAGEKPPPARAFATEAARIRAD
ncbi:AlkZ family DNA glycosylase [Kineosporia sp. J2-2]|uniref:AlkZ family DNA glycosylase n=1 Tax=Kineosporia corallincola TaxID=2835133 RepID=A0ABS5TCJ5_9ACTN|nr:winged helix DNA-binding domain-containing protein [Kineosporia corallincola]MBT0767349.1 AlkZ family DNA glycosylase [Kineosporia corallincola]